MIRCCEASRPELRLRTSAEEPGWIRRRLAARAARSQELQQKELRDYTNYLRRVERMFGWSLVDSSGLPLPDMWVFIVMKTALQLSVACPVLVPPLTLLRDTIM